MDGESKSTSIGLLSNQDLIIIVADDVPEHLFSDKRYMKESLKLIRWKISEPRSNKKIYMILTRYIWHL